MKSSWWTAALLAAASALPALAEEPAAGEKAPPAAPPKKEEAPAPGYLGLKTAAIDPEDRTDYGLPKDQDGLLLMEVTAGGPAAQAGLAAGDVLVAVDDKPIGTREAFGKLVRGTPPGTELRIRLLRKGKEEVLTVKVGAPPKAAKGQGSELDRVMEIVNRYQSSGGELREKYIKAGLSPEEADKRVMEDMNAELEAARKQGGKAKPDDASPPEGGEGKGKK